ncbi:MAG: cupredoxin domain-containing protein [Actinomycetota bacterium]
MQNKRTVVMAGVLALFAALGACGGSDEPKAAGNGSSNAVEISGFLFKPATLSVPVDTTVTWTNSDDIEHTVTSGAPDAPSGEFDSGNKSKGQTFSHTFTGSGTFTYFCDNHKSMRGEVTVT